MKNKRNIIIISIIAVLIIIVIAFFLLLRQNKPEKRVSTTTANNNTVEKTESKKEKTEETKSVKNSCPDGKKEYDGKCYTITKEARVEAKKKCGKKMINKDKGKMEEIQGTIMYSGHNFCVYGEISDVKSYYECVMKKHYWFNGKCYYDHDNNYSASCDEKYTYFANPNKTFNIDDNNGIREGCFPYSEN